VWSADDWQPADFALPPLPDRPPPIDPWRPVPVRAPRTPSSNGIGQEGGLGIWLDELRVPQAPGRRPPAALPVTATLERLFASLEFDPEARQRPWQPSASGRAPSQARRKAANLVALLAISQLLDRAAALSFLAELFEELPHPATYEALLAQVTDGVDWQTLRAMVELKRLWQETPAWWSRRRYCQLHRRVVVIRDRAGFQGLSWSLSRRLCEARWAWPVWAMIEEEWLSEWLALPFALHRCWSFAQFLDWRIDRDPDGALDSIFPELPPDEPRPGPLAWQEVAASAGSLSDLVAMRPVPMPDQLE
jgi:hypothetical protein